MKVVIRCKNEGEVSKVKSLVSSCPNCSNIPYFCADLSEEEIMILTGEGIEVYNDTKISMCGVGLCDIKGGYITTGDVRRSINADKTGLNGSGVVIGVMDTGIDILHPDVGGNVISSIDVFGEGKEGDVMGHGTHVAGCITSIAPGAKLVSIRVFDEKGQGNLSSFIKGIDNAISQGVHIINYSGGDLDLGKIQDPLVNDLVSKHNIQMVCAAGNEHKSFVASPGSAVLSVCVGSVDNSGFKSRFSNVGNGKSFIKPDVSLFGEKILSSVSDKLDVMNCGYGVMTGTSMSTGFVTGLIAQAFQLKKFSRDELESAFSKSGSSVTKNNQLGWGVIDAVEFINSLGGTYG